MLLTLWAILTMLPGEGSASSDATGLRPQWVVSFATRAWLSDAGLRPSGGQVVEEGDSIAPQIELEAQRKDLLVRVFHQFATPYDATRKFADGYSDGGLKREDTEFALGWKFALSNQHLFVRPITGYKQLTLIQENLRSEVPDDYQFRYRGPFLGASNKLLLGTRFSVDLLALVASFRVDADQVPSEAPYQPFKYDAEGYLVDLSFNATIGSVRFMLGYKLQSYPSRQEKVIIPLRDGNGDVILDTNGDPRTTTVGPPDFDAHGPILGIHYVFNL